MIASLSTLAPYKLPLHVEAFSPCMNTMRQMSTTTGKSRSSAMNLSSSTAPVMKIDDEADITKSKTTPSSKNDNGGDGDVKPTVIATALAKSFIPSPNGLSGLMAVKLREEDYSNTSITAAASAADATAESDTALPKVEGDESLLSQTGMFGGSMGAGSKKKAKEGTCVVFLCTKKSMNWILERPHFFNFDLK